MFTAMSIGMGVIGETTSKKTIGSSSATSWSLINSANCLAFLTEYSVSLRGVYVHVVELYEILGDFFIIKRDKKH